MITLVQLKCFLAVVDQPSFRRAAQQLNMSQPPLTRHIQALEHQVGVALLERSARGVNLTPAGQHFALAARRLLAGADEAVRDARRIAGGDRGALTLAFTAASSYVVLPRLMTLLRQALGDVSVSLREMSSAQQLRALQDGQIDLAVTRPVGLQRGIDTLPLYQEPLCAVVPANHPLASREHLVPHDFDRQTLITYPPVEGYYLHDLITGLLHATGVVLADIQHVTQTHSILALVGAGFGIGLVPQSVSHFTHTDVRLLPLHTAEAVRAELVLAWRSDSINPVTRLARAAVYEQWLQ